MIKDANKKSSQFKENIEVKFLQYSKIFSGRNICSILIGKYLMIHVSILENDKWYYQKEL